ncbi:MAG: hypothetical protein HQK83_08265 [Fibrobacteria bacterium]|nr:hypothetical protein [Fibrobacteria bacterium]
MLFSHGNFRFYFLLGACFLFFFSACLQSKSSSETTAVEFYHPNPEGNLAETDTLKIFVKYENGDQILLYSGPDLEGPWKGNVRKEGIEFLIQQYNGDGILLVESNYEYDFNENSFQILSKVEITPASLNLMLGKGPDTLFLSVFPKKLEQVAVWKSSNENVVTVSQTGILNPVSTGQALIIAESNSGAKDTSTVSVVLDSLMQITAVNLLEDTITLYAGGELRLLNWTTIPLGYESYIRLSSNNDSLAVIDNTYNIKPLHSGNIVITAYSSLTSSVKDSCIVRILRDIPTIYSGDSVWASKGDNIDLSVRITQVHGSFHLFKWDLEGDGIWDDSTTEFSSQTDYTHTLSHTFTKSGFYLPKYEIEDNEGNINTDTRFVSIKNISPLNIISPSRDTLVNSDSIVIIYSIEPNKDTLVYPLIEGANVIIIDSAYVNTESSDTIIVTLDKTIPAHPLVHCPEITRDTTPRWYWLSGGSDDATGLYSHSINNGSFSLPDTTTEFIPATALDSGWYIFTVREQDIAGNWSKAESCTVEIDFSAPPLPIFDDASSSVRYTQDNTPTWAWHSGGGSNLFKYKIEGNGFDNNYGSEVNDSTFTPVSALIDGDYTLTVMERDMASNWSSGISKTITIDTRAPEVIITTPSDSTVTNNVNINITWTVEGVEQTTETSENLLSGKNTITRSSTDNAGNTGIDSITIILKTNAPLKPIIDKTVSETNSPKPLWQWQSGGNGNGTFHYAINGPESYFIEDTSTVTQYQPQINLTDGNYTISVKEVDDAGNWSEKTVHTITIDTKPPVVTILTPVDNSLTNKTSIAVTWSVDSILQTRDSTASITSEGQNLIIRNAIDGAGNSGSDTIKVYRDTESPNPTVLQAVSPTNDNTPTWSWSSGGNGGNGTYRYRLGDTGNFTETAETQYTPSPLTHGTHTLYVQERDEAGNWSVLSDSTIIVDLVGPTNPTVNGVTVTSNKTPTWSWTQNGGGIGIFTIQFDGNTLSNNSSTTSYTPGVELSDGLHIIRIQEKDDVGNWSDYSTCSTTVASKVFFVKQNASGNNNGTTWEDAFNDLQSAITVATTGKQIWVATGTYKPGSTRGATFNLNPGVKWYGGFSGIERGIDDRDLLTNLELTILSGEIGTAIEGDNIYHIISLNSGTKSLLDGFIVEKGYADEKTYDGGGGLKSISDNGSILIHSCIFRHNTANYDGGAINITGTMDSVIIVNSVFSENREHAINVANLNSYLLIMNCNIYKNFSQSGGAIQILGLSPHPTHKHVVINSIFSLNDNTNHEKGLNITIEPSCYLTVSYTNIPTDTSSIYVRTTYDAFDTVSNTHCALVDDGIGIKLNSASCGTNTGTTSYPNVPPAYFPTTDIYGRPRIGTIDMGVYELQ